MKVSMRQDKRIYRVIFGTIIVIGAALWWTYGSGRDLFDTSNVNQEDEAVAIIGTGYDIEGTDSGEIIYTDYDNGFRLLLPEGWSVGGPDDSGFVWFMDTEAQAQEGEDTELGQGMKIDVFVFRAEYSTLEDWVAEETSWYEQDELLEQKEIVVGGQTATKIKVDVLGYTIATFVWYNDLEYTIAAYVGDSEDKGKYSAEFSKILSGFEFID